MENSGNGTRTVNIFGNHFHDVTNWDAAGAMYHHNGVHNYMNVSSDSLALNLYNNVADGDWGTCCTTVPLTWSEVAPPDNFNIFNNVSVRACDGETSAVLQPQITTGVVANNTLLGCPTQSGDFEAIELHGSGISFENNAIAGYGQYVVVDSGTTFTVLDYNIYGPIGTSGNSNWQCGSNGTNTLSVWQSDCSGDFHGQRASSLGVSFVRRTAGRIGINWRSREFDEFMHGHSYAPFAGTRRGIPVRRTDLGTPALMSIKVVGVRLRRPQA